MGPRPGAPAEGSPVQLQIAEAVANASPALLAMPGVFGMEADGRRQFKKKKLPQSTG